MKIRNSAGIAAIGSADTVRSYLLRVTDYADTAGRDILDIADAAVMADSLDAETLAKIRIAVETSRIYTGRLRAAAQPLQTILDSLRSRPFEDDPRRPLLYKEARQKATEADNALREHLEAIDTARDSARVHADVLNGGGITSAAMEAIARADNAHSHILLACKAAQRLLIDRRELSPYRPKL